MTTNTHNDLASRLRDACSSVRTKSFALADLIPLMQQAADALSQPAPVMYVNDSGELRSRVSAEQVEAVLGPHIDRIRADMDAQGAVALAGPALAPEPAVPSAALLVVQPDWDFVRDKRLSELTEAQKADAKELWIRTNLGYVTTRDDEITSFLLERLKAVRAVGVEALKNADRYRKLRRWMGTNVEEGWKQVEQLASIACYLSWDDFDASLDATPECNVGLCAVSAHHASQEVEPDAHCFTAPVSGRETVQVQPINTAPMSGTETQRVRFVVEVPGCCYPAQDDDESIVYVDLAGEPIGSVPLGWVPAGDAPIAIVGVGCNARKGGAA